MQHRLSKQTSLGATVTVGREKMRNTSKEMAKKTDRIGFKV